MYLTLETDYAIRIADCLARHGGRLSAKSIAAQTGVTLRFSLKILRKLAKFEIVRSYKGTQGGYEIAREPYRISMGDIVSAVEGPFTLNRCLQPDFQCTRIPDKKCPYHTVFERISQQVQEQLDLVTLATAAEEDFLPEPQE